MRANKPSIRPMSAPPLSAEEVALRLERLKFDKEYAVDAEAPYHIAEPPASTAHSTGLETSSTAIGQVDVLLPVSDGAALNKEICVYKRVDRSDLRQVGH